MASQTIESSTERRLPVMRPGAIVLARHGEPALSRKCMITAEQYRAWWADYEIGGLREGQRPPQMLLDLAARSHTIFASTRLRATQTAAAVAGEREITIDALFVEAPLPPPRFPKWIKLSPRYWGVVARFWWHVFNHHQGEETRAEAEERARAAAAALADRAMQGEDVLVIAHGYFNHMMGRELARNGWRLVQNQGFKYWSARRFERR
jgi:broad specificity phosphatase PhoE